MACCTVSGAETVEAEEVVMTVNQKGVISDSRNAVRNYQSGRLTETAIRILNRDSGPRQLVLLIWAPAHQGLGRNEEAHSVARGLTYRSAPGTSQVTETINRGEDMCAYQEITNASRAELPAEFHCRALGSRPAAQLSWWLDDVRVEPFFHEESDSGNDSFSVLLLTPTADDHGRTVRCVAANPRWPHDALEATWTLDVQYAPNVTLRLGRGLSEPVIQEGRDVYLECATSANPSVDVFQWFHHGVPLEPGGNATAAVSSGQSSLLVTGPYLIMRRVRPSQAGTYACEASNPLASVRSNTVHLTVHYSPRCERIWSSTPDGGNETLVHCRVRAQPGDRLSFTWSVRDAAGEHPVAQRGALASANGSVSVLRIPHHRTFASDGADVTLYCRARNAVGPQSSPCVLAVDTVEKPSQLRDCSVSNQSDERLLVSCRQPEQRRPGQRFVLEVHGSASAQQQQQQQLPLANLSSDRPVFWIPSLEPGAACRLVLYAVSAGGTRGAAVRLSLHADPYTAPLASAVYPETDHALVGQARQRQSRHTCVKKKFMVKHGGAVVSGETVNWPLRHPHIANVTAFVVWRITPFCNLIDSGLQPSIRLQGSRVQSLLITPSLPVPPLFAFL
ncbi:hypothetical protein HPB49_014638 [Dermacentor silvarum]|uniref:Uncharacterized protein n=1 Tax=Dermacentor silvarum TaxID=543639 RepID=A0ACB8CXT3_DERSI|nr:hypothetical protein HPB49_014638 [Dermacentor silvarum]